nr:uncharacterized protein CI109_006995 [Kwoniella shandongensis]KAA5524672.1 hypothetical protein CI109_006995 [Kwoniella shandongensis]
MIFVIEGGSGSENVTVTPSAQGNIVLATLTTGLPLTSTLKSGSITTVSLPSTSTRDTGMIFSSTGITSSTASIASSDMNTGMGDAGGYDKTSLIIFVIIFAIIMTAIGSWSVRRLLLRRKLQRTLLLYDDDHDGKDGKDGKDESRGREKGRRWRRNSSMRIPDMEFVVEQKRTSVPSLGVNTYRKRYSLSSGTNTNTITTRVGAEGGGGRKESLLLEKVVQNKISDVTQPQVTPPVMDQSSIHPTPVYLDARTPAMTVSISDQPYANAFQPVGQSTPQPLTLPKNLLSPQTQLWMPSPPPPPPPVSPSPLVPPTPVLSDGESQIGVATTTNSLPASSSRSAVVAESYPARTGTGTSTGTGTGNSTGEATISHSISDRSMKDNKQVSPGEAETKSRIPDVPYALPLQEDTSAFIPLSQMAFEKKEPNYRSPTESLYVCYKDV